MTHIPYGYELKNGKAYIHPEEGDKVKALFDAYIECGTLTKAAKMAGINKHHGPIGRMLSNRKYVGDEFYPKIVDEEIFLQVEKDRNKRAEKLGRVWEIDKEESIGANESFKKGKATEKFEDPFEQAAYIYSLIKDM